MSSDDFAALVILLWIFKPLVLFGLVVLFGIIFGGITGGLLTVGIADVTAKKARDLAEGEKPPRAPAYATRDWFLKLRSMHRPTHSSDQRDNQDSPTS